jgi:hypothetical protein
MKKSNRLLIGFLIGAICFIALVQLVLYARYHSGHYLNEADLHREAYIQYHQPPPSVLMLDGTIWVNLLPADSFYFEFPVHPPDPQNLGYFAKSNSPNEKVLSYRRSGDTLYISGNFHTPNHTGFSDLFYRRQLPQVFVYGPGFRSIDLVNGEVWLKGAADSAGRRPARLNIRNSTLWIGYYAHEEGKPAPEYFDSLEVTADNSTICLNRPARISRLNLNLADSTYLFDDYTSLRSADVGCDSSSRVWITGGNLQKFDLHHHP